MTMPLDLKESAQQQNVAVIGVDIGGTNTKVGLINLHGEILIRDQFSTNALGSDPTDFLNRLGKSIQNIYELERNQPLGIGISTHGYLDDERHGPVACLSTPALRGVNIRGWAEEQFGLPVVLNNDLIAHALGEYFFGAGRDTKRFMCLAIGTGLGIGVIINGKPLRYVGQTTGDAGRIILEPGGLPCKYEVGGSAEALCGINNIERLALSRYGRIVPAYEVISAARIGSDEIALEIIREIGSYLGLALATLTAIFLPEKVALTGGTAEAGLVLLEACKTRFDQLTGRYHTILQDLTNGLFGGVEIVLGEKPNESGLLGSVVELIYQEPGTL